jgi:hypothetical protein
VARTERAARRPSAAREAWSNVLRDLMDLTGPRGRWPRAWRGRPEACCAGASWRTWWHRREPGRGLRARGLAAAGHGGAAVRPRSGCRHARRWCAIRAPSRRWGAST